MAKTTKQQRRIRKGSGRSCSSLNQAGIRRRLADGTLVAPRSVRHSFPYYSSSPDFEEAVLRRTFGITRIAHRSKEERGQHHTMVQAFCAK